VHSGVTVIPVESAMEMYQKCIQLFPETDGAVMCAAVADFTPAEYSDTKLKRGEDDLVIRLNPTKDIAGELGRLKTENQILVGFALETNDELNNAISKLHRKNLDLIVLNSMNDTGAGFGVDTNKITLIDKDNNPTFFELKPKTEVASDIVDKIISIFELKSKPQE